MPEYRCPLCKKPSRPSEDFFPFCSPRCKSLDLGAWIDGRYRISRPLREEEADPESDPEAGGGLPAPLPEPKPEPSPDSRDPFR